MIFLDAAPANRPSADGFLHGTEQNHVHQLAIVEALEKDGDQKCPIFMRLEKKRDRARQDVNDEEAEKEKHRSLHVGRGPDLGQVGHFLTKRPQHQRAKKHQVDDRRDERQEKLEHKYVWKCDPSKRAELWTEKRVAVLPERLQRAEGPAEALANELASGFRCLGPGYRFFVVADAPTEAANRDGEVGVFRNRVRRDAAGGCDRFFAPSSERARHNRDAIQQIESALLHILA